MLGKLIKYEFKATAKFMLLMYGLFIALSALISASLAFNLDDILEKVTAESEVATALWDMSTTLVTTLFVVMNVIVVSGMFFYAIKRFKDNLLGDEGYLMHTLPVKTGDNIIAKCVVSVIWTIASYLVVAVAYFILILGISEINIFKEIAEFPWGDIDVLHALIICTEIVILLVVTPASSYLHIYASMAIGFSSNTHRVAKSVGVYVLISIALSMLNSTITNPMLLMSAFESDFELGIHIAIWSSVVVSAISAVVLYFITHHFMEKKLNLQ